MVEYPKRAIHFLNDGIGDITFGSLSLTMRNDQGDEAQDLGCKATSVIDSILVYGVHGREKAGGE